MNRNLTHLQRQAWLAKVGREIADLHADGFADEVDRLLEELYVRLQNWRRQ